MAISGIRNSEVNTQTPINKPKQVNFRGNSSNSLERTPQNDEFNKGVSTGAKVGIGIGAALALSIAADFMLTRGKYVKKLLGLADDAAKKTDDIKNNADNFDATKYLDDLEKEAKEKLAQSNKNNDEWLEQQHKLKEEEYSNWWNNAMKEKEEISEKAKKEAQEYLENEEKALKDKVAQSNRRNEEWLQEQRNIREAEYSDWWRKEMTEKVRQQIAPLETELNAIENEARTLRRNALYHKPSSITEAEAVLKKFTDKKNELTKIMQNTPEFARDAFKQQNYMAAEKLQEQIKRFKMDRSIIDNFEKYYQEVSDKYIRDGIFDDNIVRAYKNLKDYVIDTPNHFKETEALTEKAKKFIEIIEKKTPDTVEKLKENAVYSDDILENFRRLQDDFGQEHYLKRQSELNEMIKEQFREIIGANIR